MIIFLLMNLIVIISSFLITYRLFQISNFVDSVLSWFIVYLAQIVFSELLLGISGILYLNNVILVNVVILLIVWLMAKNKTSSFNLNRTRDIFYELLRNKIILLGVAVILGFALVKVGINLINPPFGWDSLNYHFTFAVEWLKHGNLATPITISDDFAPSYYPINGSLFFLWLILPFKNVFLADLGQAPFFILAFLAVYGISRKIGVNREFSLYAAVLFLLIPNVFKQLEIAYVDVMAAALFLVCINYLFLLTREFSRENVLVYSASLGLLLGTKTIALPYSALLFVPFIYLLCFKNINKSYLFIISISVVVIFGGFTYIRNFLDTGNPLYPLDFNLWGKTIFKGVIDKSNYSAHFKIGDYRLTKLLFHEGLGAQSLIFILPFIFLALPVAVIKKKKSINFNLIYFLLLPVLIYLIYRYIIPLANTRYLYPLLGIGMIIGLYTAQTLNIPRRIVNILVVICFLASMAEIAKYQELGISIILTCLLFFLLLPVIKYIRQRKIVVSIFIIIICILTLLEKDYIRNEYPRYIKMVKYSGFWLDATKAWNWLNSNTTGNNIAYVARPVPFPLYGSNFKNNVYYVSVNKTEPAKLHYFLDSRYRWGYDFLSLHKNLEEKGNYRSDADYSAWLNNLRKRNTDYLFVYSLHQVEEIAFPMEDKWARDHADKFVPVFANRTIHIYRILK